MRIFNMFVIVGLHDIVTEVPDTLWGVQHLTQNGLDVGFSMLYLALRGWLCLQYLKNTSKQVKNNIFVTEMNVLSSIMSDPPYRYFEAITGQNCCGTRESHSRSSKSERNVGNVTNTIFFS